MDLLRISELCSRRLTCISFGTIRIIRTGGEFIMKNPQKTIVTATWIGIIANIFLTLIKAVGGLLSGSKALLADALHSASDIVGSIVVLFAVKIAHKPPDEEHPYGHGKAENIASIIVAILLIFVGVEISFYSIKIFFGDVPEPPTTLALWIISFSIVIKEGLFQYKYHLGKKYHSTVLISEAWHHRSDSLSSIAALVGVAASMLSTQLGLHFLIYGDAISGIVVSFIVIRVGYSLAKDSSGVILEKVLNKEDDEVIAYEKTACSIPGVKRIDTLFARTHGSYVVIDIKLSIERHLTIEEGHTIGKHVKETLIEDYSEVENVFVHLNPYSD